jgi:ATP/maltotriose-dependent transcriptional regulator MalT
MALRLLAFKHLSLDEYSEMEALVQAAENESSRTFNDFSHAYLGAIKAMSLLMKAEFNQAYEMATLSVHNFQRLGIVGLFGPVDLYYVQARCLLEFGQREEAQALFEKTASIAKSWKHWPIYFFSRGTYIRDLALKKHFDLAFEEIKRDRELIESFYFENHLNSIVDLSEMFVRYHSKKWDRFDSLIESALDTRLSRQISNLYNLETHKKSFDSISETLEAPTPLDEIYKHLFNAGKVIDIESEAIVEMEKALRIGARIGSRETFLRQGPELGGLILKIAVHNPTLYIENLARDMAERIREREEMSTQHGELLTKRELEILRQLSTGRTLTVIAGELHISKNTMKTHLKNLYKKLEADGRDDAVAKGKARSII